jgi:heptosyltransferase-2
LIIRFSSFGDIIQALGIPASFHKQFPNSQIDWLVRDDFFDLIKDHPLIANAIAFPRKSSVVALLKLAWNLASPTQSHYANNALRVGGYTHIYDAHHNIRSGLVVATFRLRRLIYLFQSPLSFQNFQLIRRSKDRLKRWLFFNIYYFRSTRPVLPRPFIGAKSFLKPLEKWGLTSAIPLAPLFFTNEIVPDDVTSEIKGLPFPLIAIAPSAAWEMKRWPIKNWKTLITMLPNSGFVIMGGPNDNFLQEIVSADPFRVKNLAGRLTLAQSSALLKQTQLVIANDTGLLHVADQLGIPTLAIIGPTAFGYPSQSSSNSIEIELPCKPCSKDGRGKCHAVIYQLCLVSITAEMVAKAAQKALSNFVKDIERS